MRVHPLAGDIYHYALACASSDTLRMRAQASSSATSLTLLRDDENDEQEFTGSMDIQIAVNHDHDVAIEVSDDGESKTYVVHCLPEGFPDVRILKKTAGVSEDLMLLSPKVLTGLFQSKHKFAHYHG